MRTGNEGENNIGVDSLAGNCGLVALARADRSIIIRIKRPPLLYGGFLHCQLELWEPAKRAMLHRSASYFLYGSNAVLSLADNSLSGIGGVGT